MLEVVEFLLHSQMWVKGIPLHFVVKNDNKSNFISTNVINRLYLPETPHMWPYTISLIIQGQGIHVSHQSDLPYVIKPFIDEIFCYVAPL